MIAWLIWTKEERGPVAAVYYDELPRLLTRPTKEEMRNNKVIANYELHPDDEGKDLDELKKKYKLPDGFE